MKLFSQSMRSHHNCPVNHNDFGAKHECFGSNSFRHLRAPAWATSTVRECTSNFKLNSTRSTIRCNNHNLRTTNRFHLEHFPKPMRSPRMCRATWCLPATRISRVNLLYANRVILISFQIVFCVCASSISAIHYYFHAMPSLPRFALLSLPIHVFMILTHKKKEQKMNKKISLACTLSPVCVCGVLDWSWKKSACTAHSKWFSTFHWSLACRFTSNWYVLRLFILWLILHGQYT